ncbi:MAG: hypothetical protein ABI452_06275 [Candidatus Limnocylindrales bacterium]
MNFSTPWTASNGHHNGTSDKLEEMRDALAREADHFAQVAAQVGRDAGAHADDVARDVAHDTQKQTGAAMKRLSSVAATWGPAIAAMGQQRMRQVGEQAHSLGQDLSKVRITTEPKRNGAGAVSGVALIGGLGIGLGIGIASMYLLDPERGQRRREMLKAKWNELIGAKWNELTGASREDEVKELAFGENGAGVVNQPLVTEEIDYQTWPEGTRVPTA